MVEEDGTDVCGILLEGFGRDPEVDGNSNRLFSGWGAAPSVLLDGVPPVGPGGYLTPGLRDVIL